MLLIISIKAREYRQKFRARKAPGMAAL